MVDLEMGKMLLAWVASGQECLEAMNVLIQSGLSKYFSKQNMSLFVGVTTRISLMSYIYYIYMLISLFTMG